MWKDNKNKVKMLKYIYCIFCISISSLGILGPIIFKDINNIFINISLSISSIVISITTMTVLNFMLKTIIDIFIDKSKDHNAFLCSLRDNLILYGASVIELLLLIFILVYKEKICFVFCASVFGFVLSWCLWVYEFNKTGIFKPVENIDTYTGGADEEIVEFVKE